MADEDQQESAGSLRDKLAARSTLATDALARAVIAEEGLDFVKVEDFRGMDPEKVEEAARQLNSQRETDAQQQLRTLLNARGIDDLDSLIEERGTGAPPQEMKDAVLRTRHVAGSPPPTPPKVDISNVDPHDGRAQMFEHFRQQ